MGRGRRACAGASVSASQSGANLLQRWQCWQTRGTNRGARRRGDGDGDRRAASDGARQQEELLAQKRNHGPENQHDCRTRSGAEDHTRRGQLKSLTYRPKHPRSARRRNLLCAVLTRTLCGVELCDDWRRHGMAEVMPAKLCGAQALQWDAARARRRQLLLPRACDRLARMARCGPAATASRLGDARVSLTKRAAAVLPEAVRPSLASWARRSRRVLGTCEQASSNLLTDTPLLSELKGPAAVAKMRWLRLLASSHMRAHHTDYEAAGRAPARAPSRLS